METCFLLVAACSAIKVTGVNPSCLGVRAGQTLDKSPAQCNAGSSTPTSMDIFQLPADVHAFEPGRRLEDLQRTESQERPWPANPLIHSVNISETGVFHLFSIA